VFGDHGLGGLLKEGAHGKSPKCLGGNLGDFGEFCKGLKLDTKACCSFHGNKKGILENFSRKSEGGYNQMIGDYILIKMYKLVMKKFIMHKLFF